eukprot:2505445-Pyramimonas_sp.AAC.1
MGGGEGTGRWRRTRPKNKQNKQRWTAVERRARRARGGAGAREEEDREPTGGWEVSATTRPKRRQDSSQFSLDTLFQRAGRTRQ